MNFFDMDYMILLICLNLMLLLLMSKNFIVYLFLLEMLSLTVIYYALIGQVYDELMLICLMIIIVCESVLGISLMVSINFSFGHQSIEIMDL